MQVIMGVITMQNGSNGTRWCILGISKVWPKSKKPKNRTKFVGMVQINLKNNSVQFPQWVIFYVCKNSVQTELNQNRSKL